MGQPERDCWRNFKPTSIYEVACPIHDVILWVMKKLSCIHVFSCKMVLRYKRDLRIFAAEKVDHFPRFKNMFEQIKYNSRVPKAQAQCLHLKFSDIWYSVTNLVLLYTMYFSTQLLYCLYTATQRSSILTIYEYFFLCFICLFFKQIVQN